MSAGQCVTQSFERWHETEALDAAFAASDHRVSAEFEVSVDELYVLQPGRVNTPRAVGIAHALKVAGLPPAQIAKRYGLRRRESVYTAVRRVEQLLRSGGETAASIRALGLDP